ncbi:MAG: NAD-dependent deacylase [Saprospiraceae bacterium]|nr:NAD-dependent deacylase [Saprospiraceae bacterium]MDW8484092.1 NAD-dependent deacylase [Saprospiraceae bacterium]
MRKKVARRIVILTGAGISAESGLATFRDPEGIWAKYRLEDVATPEGWYKNPELVLDFYNARRRQLLQAKPNAAHYALADLEAFFEEVHIITQNIDDLHERAGSTRVLHLHGELRKVRSTHYPELVYPWDGDLHLGDCCERGAQLRPHVVWFGEEVPLLPHAADLTQKADAFVVVGTSLAVYPAASLAIYAPEDIPSYYVDPNPQLTWEMRRLRRLKVVSKPATQGVPLVVDELKRYFNVEV